MLPLRNGSTSPGLESASVPAWPVKSGGSDAVQFPVQSSKKQAVALSGNAALRNQPWCCREVCEEVHADRKQSLRPSLPDYLPVTARTKWPVTWVSHPPSLSSSPKSTQPSWCHMALKQAFPDEPSRNCMFVVWLFLYFKITKYWCICYIKIDN